MARLYVGRASWAAAAITASRVIPRMIPGYRVT
jgi:hypothetical protein